MQQPAQAVRAAAIAAEPPRPSTADAADDRWGAESPPGAGASLVPIFMRVPQFPMVRDEGFAPQPRAMRRREARRREEFGGTERRAPPFRDDALLPLLNGPLTGASRLRSSLRETRRHPLFRTLPGTRADLTASLAELQQELLTKGSSRAL